MLAVLASMLLLAACGLRLGPQTLSAPTNLKITESELLVWDPVENAREYLVHTSRGEFRTAEPWLDIYEITSEPGISYPFYVTAIGDGVMNFDSAPSETVKYDFYSYSGGWDYKMVDGGYTVAPADKEKVVGKIALPKEYLGVPIVGLTDYAFRGCDELTAIILPETAVQLGRAAFESCKKLCRINLPEGTETIPMSCFSGCSALASISLPSTLIRIADASFVRCSSLTALHIPAATVEIGGNLVSLGCEKLETLTVAEGNTVYRSEGNCVFLVSDGSMIMAAANAPIPEGTKVIAENAYEYNPIKELVIPDSVTTLSEGAFNACGQLESIHIGAGVTELHPQAFKNCDALKTVTVSEANPVFKCETNCIIKKDAPNVLYRAYAECVIPEEITVIGEMAFEGSTMSKVVLHEGVTDIGSSAFRSADITEVTLPSTLKTIGNAAFYFCKNLKSIAFPASLTDIGDNAFSGTGISEVIVPKTVKKIGNRAFYNSFITVFLPKEVEAVGNGVVGYYSVVFVDVDDELDFPSGWVSGWNGGAAVILDAKLGYEGDAPYVISFDTGRVIKNSKGYYTAENIYFESDWMYIPMLKRAGYKFAGWATEEGGAPVILPVKITSAMGYTGQEQTASLQSGDLKKIAEIISPTLYAVWEKE